MGQVYYNKSQPQLKPHGDIGYFHEVDPFNLQVYFGLKNKHNCSIINRLDFISDIVLPTDDDYSDYFYVIPESSNTLLKEILQSQGKDYIEVKKNSKEYILEQLLKHPFSAEEKKAIQVWFGKMDAHFNIHQVKTNRRKLIVPFLFDMPKIDKNKDIVIFDDIYVSGSTIAGIEHHLKKDDIPYDKIVLFCQL